MKNYLFFILLGISLSFPACSSDEEEDQPDRADQTLTLSGINNQQWTYISFTTGSVTGTSAFGNQEEDALWAQRTDWDLAICGKYLRTNGGESGKGQGSILLLENTTYENLTAAPSSGYLTDQFRTE